ncbi:MAG: hypothetical protein B1H13_10720 [Desulfobacteraceae bacterium 4484_190.3]|nr:MAG: hypothetical protein B1H13_10720 [Desulfobacteraceae bacterium 4484_190.3]
MPANGAFPITSEVIIPPTDERRAFQADFIALKIGGLIPSQKKACQVGRWALIWIQVYALMPFHVGLQHQLLKRNST